MNKVFFILIFIMSAICQAEKKEVLNSYKYSVYFFKPKLKLIGEGKLKEDIYQKEFKTDYLLIGERIPVKGKDIVGVLTVWNNSSMVIVPIVEWQVESGKILLCQTSDDGSAPRFSVQAADETSLYKAIRKRCESMNNSTKAQRKPRTKK